MNTFGETAIPVLFDQVTGRGTVVLASWSHYAVF